MENINMRHQLIEYMNNQSLTQKETASLLGIHLSSFNRFINTNTPIRSNMRHRILKLIGPINKDTISPNTNSSSLSIDQVKSQVYKIQIELDRLKYILSQIETDED